MRLVLFHLRLRLPVPQRRTAPVSRRDRAGSTVQGFAGPLGVARAAGQAGARVRAGARKRVFLRRRLARETRSKEPEDIVVDLKDAFFVDAAESVSDAGQG